MRLYLEQKTNLFTDDLRLLHFAPESVLQKLFRAMPNLDYIGVDIDSPLAQIRLDITKIPFRDGAVDVILCSHVLEHVMDDRAAMGELFRVLKPGGWAILQVPMELSRAQTYEDSRIVSPEERQRAFGRYNHVRIYGRDYKDRLRQAGFAVKVDDFAQRLGPKLIRRYGLQGEENIYFSTKPAVLDERPFYGRPS